MKSNVHFEWNGDEAERRARFELFQRITSACEIVKSQAKRLLGIAGTGRGTGGRNKKGRFKKPKAIHAPQGEPPYKQTGHLRSHVMSEVDQATLTGRVGTNVIYGRVLELTNHPWLRRALYESKPAVDAAMAKMREQE